MNSFKTLFKKDLLELKRTDKWLIYIFAFLAITVLSVVTARILPELLGLVLEETGLGDLFSYEISVADSYVQYVANMGEMAFLLITIMFATTLVKEKVSGTYHMLKSNGVSEDKIVLSHFFSKLILITASYIISIVAFVLLNLVLFREYAGIRGVVSLSYLYLFLVFGLCMALFVSSICKKKSSAIVLVIVIYFILSTISIIPYIDIYTPMYSLIISSDVITNVDYSLSDYLINLGVTSLLNVGMVIGSIYAYKNKINNRKKD